MTYIIITGIAGFIGSNFAHYIAENYPDYRIIGIDKLTNYSNRANIAALEERGKVHFIQADITNWADMEYVYQTYQPDYIVNFAAESHNDRAIKDPTSFVQTNALGAQVLLELSRRYGMRRHIHISTIEVYGEQAEHVPYFTESSPLNAKTPYSAAKAAGDMIARSYMQTYLDMDICITHCANNYGPYQFPEKLIPLAITNVLSGKKAPLYGDGLHRRDWLHVYDHCRGLDLVLHQPNKPTFDLSEAAFDASKLPIYDFSARQELSNREIIGMVLDELHLDANEWIEYVTDRPNHDRKYLINPEKVERELGFKPSIPFEEGIRATVRWYVDHQDWWKQILARVGSLQIDWSKAQSR